MKRNFITWLLCERINSGGLAANVSMVAYCSVPQCRTYAAEPGVSFHHYPRGKKMRETWLVKLKMGKDASAHSRVCSKHFRDEDFVYAAAAKMFGWKKRGLAPEAVPSLNLPVRPLDRPRRPERRPNRAQNSEDRPLALVFPKNPLDVLPTDEAQPSTSSGDPVDHADLNFVEDGNEGVPADVIAVYKEIGVQVDTSSSQRSQPLSISKLQDGKDLNVLTGIPCFQLFYNITDLYTESRVLARAKSFCISNEDAVLMSLMRLRHNMSFSVLAVLFGVHRTTASDIFKSTVVVLAEILRKAVYWPSKEAVVDNLTVHFKEYTNVRAVLDCTEVPLQRPKDLESQLLIYSWYKGTYTAKVLICETPGGHISYVSEAYGGRASDSFITKESKIMEKFLPSIDSVMVDKGFLIDQLCLDYHVEMVRPPFLRKSKQLSKRDAERNQSIAAARVHVERAIQRMKQYKILTGNLGVELFPYIDNILHVIAGIVNLSKPIFTSDKFLAQQMST